MNYYVSVLRSILAHHVRQMERATLRCGMSLSWLHASNAKEVVAKWYENESQLSDDSVNDSVQFISLLTKRDEAEEFLLDAQSVVDEDEELDEGIKYLKNLTHLAGLRLCVTEENLKEAGMTPAAW